MCSVKGGHHMKSRVVFVFSTDDTLILAIHNVEFIIINCRLGSWDTTTVWFKAKLYCERIIANFVCQVSFNIPHCFLHVTIREESTIWSDHLTIFIHSLFAWVLFYYFLSPDILLLLLQLMLCPSSLTDPSFVWFCQSLFFRRELFDSWIDFFYKNMDVRQ